MQFWPVWRLNAGIALAPRGQSVRATRAAPSGARPRRARVARMREVESFIAVSFRQCRKLAPESNALLALDQAGRLLRARRAKRPRQTTTAPRRTACWVAASARARRRGQHQGPVAAPFGGADGSGIDAGQPELEHGRVHQVLAMAFTLEPGLDDLVERRIADADVFHRQAVAIAHRA